MIFKDQRSLPPANQFSVMSARCGHDTHEALDPALAPYPPVMKLHCTGTPCPHPKVMFTLVHYDLDKNLGQMFPQK